MRRLRAKLTYANAVATIALFIALGGAAFAATKLPANSVGTKQLKNGAVTGAKVKSGSLLSSNFAQGQLPAGPQGPKGETGREGREGEPGQQGVSGERGESGENGEPGTTHVVTRYGPEVSVPVGLGSGYDSYAACEPGETPTGGGYHVSGSTARIPRIFATEPAVIGKSGPETPPEDAAATGWLVQMFGDEEDAFTFRAYVMCAAT